MVLPGPDSILNVIFDRRSIRKFQDRSVPPSVLQKLLMAGTRAPFAAQLYSIIYVKDKEKIATLRQELKIGIYPTTQLFMLFCVDFNILEKVMEKRGYHNKADDGMSLWLAVQDASLVAENVILTAEHFGLGSVLLGAVPQFADQISEEFKLPKRVFPVVGLCMGYPDPSAETDVRPRYPLRNVAFEDVYKDLSDPEVEDSMREMDEGYLTQGYYIKLNAKVPLADGRPDSVGFDKYSWTEHISRKFAERPVKEPLLEILKRHGFRLEG